MPSDSRGLGADIDGRPATTADLIPLAFAGFAHFTAMQVRSGQVKGLDLHLARLKAAAVDLFGSAFSDEHVRSLLRTAIAGGPDALSRTATMFTRTGEFTDAGGASEEPSGLIRTGPASSGPDRPLKLAAVEHERPFPAVKHVGEASKTYYLRKAVREGFDDAAFVDRSGRLTEATIWNLAFWDGASAIWPEGAMLPGTTMGIVRRQLERLGIHQRREPITLNRVATLKGAALMNSWTRGIAVTAIASAAVPVAQSLMEVLHQAYAAGLVRRFSDAWEAAGKPGSVA